MGWNSVAVLLHDHNFERDGNLGKRIARAIRFFNSRDQGLLDRDFHGGQIISQDHADGEQVVVVHGNTGCRVTEATGLGRHALDEMQGCLEAHGYTIKKPRKSPRAKSDGEVGL